MIIQNDVLVTDCPTESILGYAPTRNQFLDDVSELETFLLFRQEDLASDTKGKAAVLIDPMQVSEKLDCNSSK
jgi:hypothetical protein